MSTKWTLSCVSSGSETSIEVTDGGTWKALTPSDWDVPGGNVVNYGQPTTFLGNGTPTPHELRGMSKRTLLNDTGEGTKKALDGAFPLGDFKWTCTGKK